MELTWTPYFVATVLLLVLWALHRLNQVFEEHWSKTHHLGYTQLIAKLDAIVFKLNDLEPFLQQIQKKSILDQYESALRLMETLLKTIQGVSGFGNEPQLVKSAFVLARQCGERVDRVHHAARQEMKRMASPTSAAFAWASRKVPKVRGCYFCSRPYSHQTFKQVRAQINGQTAKVYGCEICREELRLTNEVRVLFFMKNGQPVHWAQVQEYQPSENFWDLNKKARRWEKPRLEVIATKE